MLSRAQRDHLAQKLNKTEAQLLEAKADQHDNQRSREISNALASLKRLFPGAEMWLQLLQVGLSMRKLECENSVCVLVAL